MEHGNDKQVDVAVPVEQGREIAGPLPGGDSERDRRRASFQGEVVGGAAPMVRELCGL
jgi:hypothetical protein